MFPENAIEVANPTKLFDSILAVDNITFGVEEGQIFDFLFFFKRIVAVKAADVSKGRMRVDVNSGTTWYL